MMDKERKEIKNKEGAVKGYRRHLWLIPGGIAFVLGTVGTVLPVLPTVPFYMLALVCFAKGSDRVHKWFINTRLYHNHLEDLINKKCMTLKTKITVITSISALMGLGIYMMKGIFHGQLTLGLIWAIHMIYFLFFIKTERKPCNEVWSKKSAERCEND